MTCVQNVKSPCSFHPTTHTTHLTCLSFLFSLMITRLEHTTVYVRTHSHTHKQNTEVWLRCSCYYLFHKLVCLLYPPLGIIISVVDRETHDRDIINLSRRIFLSPCISGRLWHRVGRSCLVRKLLYHRSHASSLLSTSHTFYNTQETNKNHYLRG